MAADDLGGRVALDTLGARIPGRDVARRVEHENGVIERAVDEQPERLLAVAQREIGVPALGEIARDLAESYEPSGLIQQRGDDDVGPESRAVLAHAPTVIFEPAITRRELELLPWPSLVDRILWIEHREVFADDLLRCVSLHPARTFVPTGDMTGRIQQEDGVVAGAFDQQPKRVGLLQRCGANGPVGSVQIHVVPR